MSKRRKIADTIKERPHLSIPQPEPREKSKSPLGNTSEKRRVIEIDLVSSRQDIFTIDL